MNSRGEEKERDHLYGQWDVQSPGGVCLGLMGVLQISFACPEDRFLAFYAN